MVIRVKNLYVARRSAKSRSAFFLPRFFSRGSISISSMYLRHSTRSATRRRSRSSTRSRSLTQRWRRPRTKRSAHSAASRAITTPSARRARRNSQCLESNAPRADRRGTRRRTARATGRMWSIWRARIAGPGRAYLRTRTLPPSGRSCSSGPVAAETVSAVLSE